MKEQLDGDIGIFKYYKEDIQGKGHEKYNGLN